MHLMTEKRTLSTKQQLLCTAIVRGYCLTFKTWGENVCTDGSILNFLKV